MRGDEFVNTTVSHDCESELTDEFKSCVGSNILVSRGARKM